MQMFYNVEGKDKAAQGRVNAVSLKHGVIKLQKLFPYDAG